MIKNPLISVIVPVYNVEEYLEDTLKSIIRQNIGFKENIQLIIVNDGSKDNSEDVILKYKSLYPENIEYINQKNSGVSVARNKGLKRSTGKYISFIDGDDVISRNFYHKSVKVFEKYKNRIDIVVSKIVYIEARFEDHYLNYKFKNNDFVDVNQKPGLSIFHLTSALIKRSATRGMFLDERLAISEDVKFLTEVLRIRKAYGLAKGSVYYYRDRINHTSAIDRKARTKSYFNRTPQLFLEHTLNKWSENKVVHRYAQHLVMNDIAWKIKEDDDGAIDNNELQEYKNNIYSIVSKIDDEVIVGNRLLDYSQKKLILTKKYGQEGFEKNLSFADGTYYFKDIKFVGTDSLIDQGVYLDFINPAKDNIYIIEGHLGNVLVSSEDKVYFRSKTGLKEVEYWDRKGLRRGFMGDLYTHSTSFRLEAYIDSRGDTIDFIIEGFDGTVNSINIYTKQFTGLGPLNKSYVCKNDTVFVKNKKSIATLPLNRKNKITAEVRFAVNILKNLQLKKSKTMLKSALKYLVPRFLFGTKKATLLSLVAPFALTVRSMLASIRDLTIRQMFFIGLYKSNRPIWIISDRGAAAGDNGEAMFKYLCDNEKDSDIYFVISKKSSDFNRLRLVGNVIHNNSLKFKLLFLRSSFVISSSADHYVYNPFGYRWTHLSDLYRFKFVFLQHGITKDDLSAWLNRFEKNISLFITSGRKEYRSILSGDYYYTENEVVLSGMPRYDSLYNNSQGKIMLAPTWRHNLLKEKRGDKSGIRQKSEHFKNTQYYKFYNNLINNSRLIEELNRHDIKGEFYIHPAFTMQIDDFQYNETFYIKKMPYNYNEAFAKSNLLITDYSSVAFDFAYLNKPVIYTHFDKDTLYDSHIYEQGYFSYENDGFGPVVYDLEGAIDTIINNIKQGMSMDDKYKKRVTDFFAFDDKLNTKRVHDAIKALDSGGCKW